MVQEKKIEEKKRASRNCGLGFKKDNLLLRVILHLQKWKLSVLLFYFTRSFLSSPYIYTCL